MVPSPDSQVVERLRASGTRALGLVSECRSAADTPAATAKLWQIGMTLELVLRLPECPDTCGLDDVIADLDKVTQHLQLSKLPSFNDLELAHLTSQRVLMEISHLAAWDRAPIWPGTDGLTADRVHKRREALISAYDVDARHRRREALGLAVLALLSFAAAVGIAVSASSSSNGGSTEASDWLPPLIAALMAFIVGVALFHGSQRHRLASFEATRLQRQLAALDDLLAPLPPSLQALTRATILRQLFPRLREDSEPWLESAWPNSATALEAMELDRTSPAQASGHEAA